MSELEFREWLQNRLDEKGWNYSELADKAGVSRGAIANVMRGERSPGPDLCKAIAAGLGIPTKLVFVAAGFLEPEKELTPNEIMVLHYLSQLLPEDQERVMLYLEVLAARYKYDKKRP